MTLAQKKMAAMIMEGKDVATAAVESGVISQEAEEAEMQMSDDEADAVVQKVEQSRGLQSEARSSSTSATANGIKVS